MDPRKRPEYCNIVTCINNKGTVDKNEQMFRVPTDAGRRTEWLNAIEKQQIPGQNITQCRSICKRHFSDSDFNFRGQQKLLKLSSVPTKFNDQNNYDFTEDDVNTNIDSDDIEMIEINIDDNEKCNECIFLERKITDLETQMINMNIEKQKLELKIESLREERRKFADQLRETQKAFSKEKQQTHRLAEIIRELKAEHYISPDDEKFLQRALEMNEIVECLVKGIKPPAKYPPSVRSFCMSLHFASPKAYEYVRNKFGKNIPHSETIKEWYRTSDLDSSSGISEKSLDSIEKLAKEMRCKGIQLTISLLLDEMAILRNMTWCRNQNKFVGLADCGTTEEDGEFSLANNVIVFMACGINANFQQPVAYHFIKQLKSHDRAELVKKVIIEIAKRGIKVEIIVFDGFSANGKMCQLLGADINLKNGTYITDFPNPFDESKVFIIYDPSHMEKLVRNTLGTREVFWDEDGEKIEWNYFKLLVDISRQRNFGLTHKLNKRHIEFQDRKMHVRTAVETLSNSSADSMEFLMKNDVEKFADAAPTIKFTRMFNTLWDIFNSQRIRSGEKNAFKNALNPLNKVQVFNFLKEVKRYILSLKVEHPKTGKQIPIVSSDWRTGFRGFIINIITLEAIYSDLMEDDRDKYKMSFLATYRLSQDHLEMFFGKIRSMNGYSDNPTAVQFNSAYRKLLHQCDIHVSALSNVKALVSSNVLTVPSFPKRRTLLEDEVDEFNENFNGQDEVDDEISDWNECFEWNHQQDLDYLMEGTEDSGIVYAANIIERKMTTCKEVYCMDCLNVLNNNTKVNTKSCVSVQNGKPCLSTYQLCKLTDNALKLYINTGPQLKQKIYLEVMRNISWNKVFPVFYEPEHDSDHKRFLVKFIIDEYIHKKCAYVAKQKTLDLQKKYLRNRLRKIYHHMHQ